ncbi:MAG: hypothetical protein ACK4L8_13775 [Nitrincola lacisaponensis]|uniref:PglD-related sugar-binding protein n=1 Tax=Nitrincola lacisaponensis TaxID=267850 RepID=UPI00391B89A6
MRQSLRIGIFGTSGMAREAGDIAFACGLEPVYVARDEVELNAWKYHHKVILEKNVTQYTGVPFVIGVGENKIRKAIAERFKNILKFTNLIHPSATFGYQQREEIQQSEGVIVAAGVRLTSSISVGDFCIFNQNVTVAHDSVVENYVHIAPGANISGNIHLKAGCWVGAGAVINQGGNTNKLIIGENTIVGSGAVVIKNCESDAVYVGVPAKRIK